MVSNKGACSAVVSIERCVLKPPFVADTFWDLEPDRTRISLFSAVP